jgi:alpha-glucosidase
VKVAWENIMGSASEEEYNSSVKTFKERYGHWSEFIEYVETTILGPAKEKFERIWTDRVMHLGNTTTNKAESAHARLKKYVPNILGDICKNWGEINRMLINMFSEIHKDFQQSIIFRDERWKGIVLRSELQGNISREALGYLLDEVRRAEVIGTDKARCKGTI